MSKAGRIAKHVSLYHVHLEQLEALVDYYAQRAGLSNDSAVIRYLISKEYTRIEEENHGK
jgi:hypothetical protein